MPRTILSLCNGRGTWEQPYRNAGYRVLGIDPANGTGDVRNIEVIDDSIHGVLAAPPCTEFAGSGARWWAGKSPELLEDAIATVYACLHIIEVAQPVWWALENPVGRLPDFIGPWNYTWQPYEFGDPYTKRTCMWGRHRRPETSPVEPTEGSNRIMRLGPSPERAAVRSETPQGFAQAFFDANP